MCLTHKAGLVPAFLVLGVLTSLPAHAQTLGTPSGFSGTDFGSMVPTPSGCQDSLWHDFASLGAATDFRPGGRPTVTAVGANPSFKWDASAFDVFGLSSLLIPGFTYSTYSWSAPAGDDDLRLWINGLGPFDPGARRYPLYANVVYGGVISGGTALGYAIEDER